MDLSQTTIPDEEAGSTARLTVLLQQALDEVGHGRPPSDGEQLAAAIQLWRQELGWSRDDLAQAMEVAAQTIWRWERASPLPNRDNLMRLLTLVASPAAAAGRAREVVSFDLDQYLAEQQEYLKPDNEPGPPKIEIWVLGPQHLPVLDSRAMRETWVANVLAGFQYHLIWLLDSVPRDAVARFSEVLRTLEAEVDQRARDRAQAVPGGLIHHHLTVAYSEAEPSYEELVRDITFGGGLRRSHSERLFYNRDTFRWLAESSPQAWRYNRIHEVVYFGEELRHCLVEESHPYGAVVVYYHRARPELSLAGYTMAEVLTEPGNQSTKRRVSFYLPADKTRSLVELISSVRPAMLPLARDEFGRRALQQGGGPAGPSLVV